MTKNMMYLDWRKLSLLPVLALLVSCGGGDASLTSNLSGQVAALTNTTSNKSTHFAASRFLEQASMGPSPSSVAQVKAQGIEGWITSQLKLPPSLIVTPPSFCMTLN